MLSVPRILERSVIDVRPLYLLLNDISKSLRKIAKSSGDKFYPCLTPMLQAKRPDIIDCCLTHDLAVSYIL